MRIDDERDLHEQLEAAFEAMTPRPAPVAGAVRRGRAIRVRRRVAVAAGAAAAVAIGVLAVPSLVHHLAAPGPVTQTGRYTVTVQPPAPRSAPGLIASGTIDGRSWHFSVGKPGTGGAGFNGQILTASGPAFGGNPSTDRAPALVVDSADPVSFLGLTSGPVQVQYGAVRSDVTYIAVRLDNGTVLTLHPVTVYGVRAVAFAIPVGAGIAEATAYSPHGEIAAAIPFDDPSGMADFGMWLTPGQHGLARASGRIGSGTFNRSAWSATAYLGPWGICIQVPGFGTSCMPTASGLGPGYLSMTVGELSVAAGSAPASTAWIIVKQPDGTSTQVRPVTVDGLKLFAFQLRTGPNRLGWSDYASTGAVVGSWSG